LFNNYHNRHVGGQAIYLTESLLQANITQEMEPLLTKRSLGLAEDAIFYLERMVNLHTGPVPRDIQHYHAKHQFSLMSLKQKIFHVVSFLHPFPEDAAILPLPKPLHFLYFLLRPMLWAWRKTKKQALS
jgi:hypothetical protein